MHMALRPTVNTFVETHTAGRCRNRAYACCRLSEEVHRYTPTVSLALRQAPLVLQLRDDSLPAEAPPVGMYLHSRLAPLFAASQPPRPMAKAHAGPTGQGPASTGLVGTVVRLANVRARRAPASTGIPPRLLPAAEAVVLARDRADAAALLRQLPVSGVAQVSACRKGLAHSRDAAFAHLLSKFQCWRCF